MHTLTMLGIGWNEVKREIYELTPSDYLQGPEIDRDYPETEPFWMFKKNVDGHIIYVKFKVLHDSDGGVKLVSFHLDEK